MKDILDLCELQEAKLKAEREAAALIAPHSGVRTRSMVAAAANADWNRERIREINYDSD